MMEPDGNHERYQVGENKNVVLPYCTQYLDTRCWTSSGRMPSTTSTSTNWVRSMSVRPYPRGFYWLSQSSVHAFSNLFCVCPILIKLTSGTKTMVLIKINCINSCVVIKKTRDAIQLHRLLSKSARRSSSRFHYFLYDGPL